jgi:serine/threonine-protein kinase
VRDSGSIFDGKYQILDRLGRGGMGEVYKVRHLHLQETRVIKILRPDLANDAQLVQRFVQEARLATQVKHPNIAMLHDISRLPDGSYYMVWEYVEGQDVGRMLREGPIQVSLTVDLGIQALRGLGAIHGAGIVHRDLSPDNLMVGKDASGRPVLKIIDLGLARQIAIADKTDSDPGMVMGKLRYCSPEQAGKDANAVDARSDLYSLAAVLYEMVCGLPPFNSETPHGFVLLKLSEEPLPLASRNPRLRVPDELSSVLRRGLAREPDRRFPDAASFLQGLVRVRDLLRGASTLEMPRPRFPAAEAPPGGGSRRELRPEERAELLARIEKASQRSEEGMRRLEEAQRALNAGELDQARELLEGAAQYVPQSALAIDLRRRLEDLLSAREQARRSSEAETLFEKFLAARKLTQARLAFETVREMWPANPRTAGFAARLDALQAEIERERGAEAVLRRATEALREGSVTSAELEAVKLKESGAIERSAWLEAEIERAKRERENERSSVWLRKQVEEALGQGDIRAAERDLEKLSQTGVSKVTIDLLYAQLEEARAAADRLERLADHERRFRVAVTLRDWSAARAVAHSLAAALPGDPAASQLMLELTRREEGERRLQAIDQGVAQVETFVAAKNAQDAELALRIVLKLDPENPNRKRLEKQIEALWRG